MKDRSGTGPLQTGGATDHQQQASSAATFQAQNDLGRQQPPVGNFIQPLASQTLPPTNPRYSPRRRTTQPAPSASPLNARGLPSPAGSPRGRQLFSLSTNAQPPSRAGAGRTSSLLAGIPTTSSRNSRDPSMSLSTHQQQALPSADGSNTTVATQQVRTIHPCLPSCFHTFVVESVPFAYPLCHFRKRAVFIAVFGGEPRFCTSPCLCNSVSFLRSFHVE